MTREARKESSKEKILNAALQEFGQKGYAEASTNNMCKNHHISKGLLFHYYKSKDELFLLCVEKCFNTMGTYLEEALDRCDADVNESLNHYFEVKFKFFKDYPLYEQIFYTSMNNTPQHLKEEMNKRRQAINLINKSFLKQLMDRLPLKTHMNQDVIIELIEVMGNYLNMKYKGDYSKDVETRHEVVIRHNREIKELILILFYGIVDNKGGTRKC